MDYGDTSHHSQLVLDAMRRIVRRLRVSDRASETRLGVSAAQLFVLQKLSEAPASSIRELARHTLTDPSSVSTVVARLVERRLVGRATSRQDSRRAELSVTALGRQLLSRAPEPAQKSLVAALDRLAPEQLRRLALSLGELVEELGVSGGAAPMFFEEVAPRKKARPTHARA